MFHDQRGAFSATAPTFEGVIDMDVTAETFERDVIERSYELPIVVDFWAAWCGPCRMLAPAIEAEVAKREGKIELAKVDVQTEQMLAASFGIQSIPTVAVFRDGKLVSGFVGALPAAAIGTFLDDLIEDGSHATQAA
jgi:putative thioredoxin